MQFFLYEILARIIAIYLFIDTWRKLRNGLAERKIRIFNPDVLNWFLDWSSIGIIHRDTAPIRYWVEIGMQTIILVLCFLLAILGWWHPDS
jgi:hypothetical protein